MCIIKSKLSVLTLIIFVAMFAGPQTADSNIQTGRENFPILINEDDRVTVREYARKKQLPLPEVEKSFAATGKLNCPWTSATANLIMKNDLIATVAHLFFDRKGNRKGKMDKCRFIANSSGKEMSVQLSNEYVAGHAISESRTLSAQDWVVVRLADSISGVTPYLVPLSKNPLSPINETEGKRLWKVTVVAARHNDWPQRNGKTVRDIKSISECAVRGITWPSLVLSYNNVSELRSDCDSSPGSSGAAYLYKATRQHFLVGLTVGLGLTAKLGRHKYDLEHHHARGVLINGAFLNAVKDMGSMTDVAKIQQALAVLGYKPGPIDGKMGGKTRNAIKEYERAEGLPATGEISTLLTKFLSAAISAR